MKILTMNSWQRRGSTILFDQTAIQQLLKKKSMVSLREFLTWHDNIPEDPPIPGNSHTILVCGLETVLETLSPEEAKNFLKFNVRPIIKNIQDFWNETGIVFGFTQGRSSFEETNNISEEVLFLRSDNQKIPISTGLWDGTAYQNMQRLETTAEDGKSNIVTGYYVDRIS